jgi:hypothetical protein
MIARIVVPVPASLVSRIAAVALMFFSVPFYAQIMPAQITPSIEEPLVVTLDSRVAVIEYEAWFGPDAVTFQGSAAMPLLQSADMQAVGGGYDSADPAVIRQHVEWMESIGIDAALVDLTNDVSCIFDSKWFVQKYLTQTGGCLEFRTDFQNIRDNTGNLYPVWTRMKTPLKLIPLLGGIDQDVLYEDEDGKTAFEKEVSYFGNLMEKYPGRQVVYKGKPLMVVYLGAAQDPQASDNPLWYQIRRFVEQHPAIAAKYTFRYMAGYLDSQPYLWKNQAKPTGPVAIAPEYGFWSWVDRLNIDCETSYCPYYPSFNPAGLRTENFTASVATAGQNGWGCPNEDALPYCTDDALRYGKEGNYLTFERFMKYARQLDPVFLFVHQFNEFGNGDEGFDADTNDEIEPANLWGQTALPIVKEELAGYHHHARILDSAGPPPAP